MKKILSEHTTIRGLLGKVQAYLEQPIDDRWLANVCEALRALVETLTSHFETEEQSGMHVEMRAEFPRLAVRFERVMSDHPAILSTLEELVRDVGQKDAPEPHTLIERVRRAIQMIQEHEQAETAIIMDAHWDDLGVGD